MAILQSIRCHKSCKTHVFLSRPALQGKLLGFQCTQLMICGVTANAGPPSAPGPTSAYLQHHPHAQNKVTSQTPNIQSPVPAPQNTQVWGQGSYLHRTQSQSQKKKKKRHRKISASPAWRHPCRELLEVGGRHGTSRTHTQLKPPAGAKLALYRGSVTHLCLILQSIPEWMHYLSHCISHQLMDN